MAMKLETKVGAFFLGTLGILGLLILRVEKLDVGGRGKAREAVAHFDQVAGLAPQGAVRIAGVKVGEVKRIELDRGKAKVVISFQEDVPVYADAVATLSSIGILGEKYVELNPGTDQAGGLKDGQEIRSQNAASLDTLIAMLQDIGKDVKGVTGALNASIGGEQGRQKLDEIVDNIRVLTAEFRSMAQENHGAINNTLANVEAISSDLRDRLPKLAQQFELVGKNLNAMLEEERPELKGLMGDVRKLAQNFQATGENLRVMTDKINRGEGTVGKLLNDESTVKKLNEAIDNASELLGGFKKLELRLDMGGEQWTKRSDSRTHFGIELVPRPDYWYQVELASTPDGKVAQSTRTVQQLDPITGQPTTTTLSEKNVTVDQAFTLSAQFAKRVGPVVFTGGIVESKGGGGVEVRGFEDRLRAGLLAYDFAKREGKNNPRYRFTTSWQFWKGAYISTGVQDIANKDLRTFFVGGGLRWRDEDLKKLVGLAAGAK